MAKPAIGSNVSSSKQPEYVPAFILNWFIGLPIHFQVVTGGRGGEEGMKLTPANEP